MFGGIIETAGVRSNNPFQSFYYIIFWQKRINPITRVATMLTVWSWACNWVTGSSIKQNIWITIQPSFTDSTFSIRKISIERSDQKIVFVETMWRERAGGQVASVLVRALMRGNPRHKIFGYFSQNLWIMDYKVWLRGEGGAKMCDGNEAVTL